MYENITPEGIKAEILAEITGMDTSEGSYINILVSPIAYQIWTYYTALEAVMPIIFVDETSGPYIDKWCAVYGIVRKPGTKAKAVISFEGTAGMIVPAGKIFLTEDGRSFELESDVILADGSGEGTVVAIKDGSAYNVPVGAISVQSSTLPGLTFWENQEATGGTDEESDAALVGRLYEFLQKPSTSGNIYHYRQWAKETTGVGECRVFPLWDGPGTVKVVISGQDGGVASKDAISDCKNHIEEMRPVGAEVTVVSAQELAINISAVIVTDNTITVDDVKAQFEKGVKDYLESIAFKKDEVVYARIAFILMDIPGVQDYKTLTINDGDENIVIADEEIPVLGVVQVAAG